MTAPPDHDKPRRAKIAAMNQWPVDPAFSAQMEAYNEHYRLRQAAGPRPNPTADLTTLVQRLERAVGRLEALAAVKVPDEPQTAPAGNVGAMDAAPHPNADDALGLLRAFNTKATDQFSTKPIRDGWRSELAVNAAAVPAPTPAGFVTPHPGTCPKCRPATRCIFPASCTHMLAPKD